MDILVCVKQVPDNFVEVHLDASTRTPAIAAIEPVANAFDTYAIELATRYCEANGGSVTAVTIGPDSAKNTLKNLLAVGAGKALLYNIPIENADENAVACYLAKIIKKLEAENGAQYGMILCGKESTDEISSQVGALLAEKLELGFVSSVIEVEPRDGGFTAKRETEEGFELYETASPAVFTIAKPAYDPRYPSIKSKMAARKAEIPTFSAQDSCIEAVSPKVVCTVYTEPPKRVSGMRIQEKVAADAAFKAVEKMANDRVL